jgi:TetR/AcrR family transcriptional regulator
MDIFPQVMKSPLQRILANYIIQHPLNWSAMKVQPPSRGPKATPVHPDQILDAAQAVFGRDGIRGASLRAIAREAGCDPALIYYHFEHKEALFQALLARRFPLIQQDMEKVAASTDLRPSPVRIWAVLCIYHRHLQGDPGLRSMIRGEIVQGAEGVQDLIKTQIRPVLLAISHILEQGQARGEIRADLQALLATFFLVRMQLEILDLMPIVLRNLPEAPAGDPVATGMRAWFELYWRGIAQDPLAPLPLLPDLAC